MKAPRRSTRLPVIICLILLALWGLYGLADWWRARERRILAEEVFHPLSGGPHCNEEGFWIGDVAENYRLGKLSKELAAADSAPLNPLTPKPVPFHGYFVRVMDLEPLIGFGQAGVPAKGMRRCRDNYAIMAYPAVPGEGKHTIIFSTGGYFLRHDAWVPTFSFPTDDELKQHWGKPGG